jgi:hypothetical protein
MGLRNASDARERRIAGTEEFRAKARLSLLIPRKCRVHFEGRGGEDGDG